MTNCFNTEETLLIMIMIILLNDKVNDTTISFNITDILCRSYFNIKIVKLIVNASTAEII